MACFPGATLKSFKTLFSVVLDVYGDVELCVSKVLFPLTKGGGGRFTRNAGSRGRIPELLFSATKFSEPGEQAHRSCKSFEATVFWRALLLTRIGATPPLHFLLATPHRDNTPCMSPHALKPDHTPLDSMPPLHLMRQPPFCKTASP